MELRTKTNVQVLTYRETEYLTFVALGCKNKQIGLILSVSNNTVKKTLENIFQKIFAKDRANAITIAFTYGILTPQIIDDIKNKFIQQIITLKDERFNI